MHPPHDCKQHPMPVIAIVNPKGGSGKSTLATHLAGHAASLGLPVMLGDIDRQKSTVVWLRRRALEPLARRAPVMSWVVDSNKTLRPPSGVTHVVLDTPGALRGLALAHVLMSADAVLMPVCESAFDRDAAAQCWAELAAHPRVASGRCRVAIIGMRIDARTHAEATLRAWAEAIGAPFLGVLRDTQTYVKCVERGLTIFDLPAARTQTDRAQWTSVLEWLDPLWTQHDLATPSQAGALDEAANDGTLAAAPRSVQSVLPGPRAARPVLKELADALRPVPPPRRWFAQGWWPWARA